MGSQLIPIGISLTYQNASVLPKHPTKLLCWLSAMWQVIIHHQGLLSGGPMSWSLVFIHKRSDESAAVGKWTWGRGEGRGGSCSFSKNPTAGQSGECKKMVQSCKRSACHLKGLPRRPKAKKLYQKKNKTTRYRHFLITKGDYQTWGIVFLAWQMFQNIMPLSKPRFPFALQSLSPALP